MDMQDLICPFGKHKGKLISEIVKEEPDYLIWIINNVTNNTKIVECSRQYIQNQPPPQMRGSLVQRVKLLTAHPNKQSIIKDSNIDTFCFSRNFMHLSDDLCRCLQRMKETYDNGFGCFFDYLARRIIALHIRVTPQDDRAKSMQKRLGIEDNDSEYDIFQDMSVPTKDALQVVCNISSRHNIYFNDHRHEKHEALRQLMPSLRPYMGELESLMIEKLIPEFTDKGEVFINPDLTYGIPAVGGISADADLIVDTTLWEFKTVSGQHDEKNMLQLLGYTALAMIRGKTNMTRVGIINPISKVIDICDVSEWNETDIIKFLAHLGIEESYERKQQRMKEEQKQRMKKEFGKPQVDLCTEYIQSEPPRKCKKKAQYGPYCTCHAKSRVKRSHI